MAKFSASKKHTAKAESLGYTVGIAWEGYEDPNTGEKHPTVYRVEGYGMSAMMRDDEQETWDQFLVPEAHEHRANLARHMNPDDELEMSEDEIMQSSFRAAVAVGIMAHKEAEKALDEWRENVKAARADA